MAQAQQRPVGGSEREPTLDLIRGLAVLGILGMNIVGFAHPTAAYYDPVAPPLAARLGAFEGLGAALWWLSMVLLDVKFITLFSVLFGAGLMMMNLRLGARQGRANGRFAWLHYRRMGWLLLFGLVHAYGIWWGDVLGAYAVCGMLIYPLRRLPAWWLSAIGVALLLVGVALSVGGGFGYEYGKQQTIATDGHEWWLISEENVEAEVGAMRRVPDVWRQNAANAVGVWMIFWVSTLWRSTACMLFGMAMVRSGVLLGRRSVGYFVRLSVIGYAVGIPLAVIGAQRNIDHRFDWGFMLRDGLLWNYAGSFGVAAGHAGLLLALHKAGALAAARARLMAVGRMAFTNYIAQSLICTAVFYGWGLGQYGSWERPWLYALVAGVWLVQLAWSPAWLGRFRYGPLEWLWRTLAYWKLQPMRAGRSGGLRAG
ncbi:MAG: hypothetical protein C0468_01390 [Planctomyces sp.]|nr:hypothetical protein [Planctomyces sp.]MBA4120327.1 hypothetical protein [Isosphaera sp.]